MQLHHYLSYCSKLLSLTAKTSALCAEHSADGKRAGDRLDHRDPDDRAVKQDLAEDLADPACRPASPRSRKLSTIGQVLVDVPRARSTSD